MLHASSDLSNLRDAVSRIEGRGAGRESGLEAALSARAGSRVSLGAEPLDRLLGGGLQAGSLHEVVAESPRDEATASGFAASLAGLVARGRTLVWILDDRVAWEVGTPYRPGLAAHGLDPDKLILVKTKDAMTTLWATEEALKAGAPVVLTELWRASSYDLVASRRLLLAARARGATSLVVPIGLPRDQAVSSSADTRFAVAAAPSLQLVPAGAGLPLPGAAGFAVRLVKRRNGPATPAGGFDRDEVHHIAWDRTRQRFGLSGKLRPRPPFGAGPLRPPAVMAHGSAA